METTLTTSGSEFGGGYGNLYGDLVKDNSDTARQQASDSCLSNAILTKQIVDTADQAVILSALQTKQITDDAANASILNSLQTKNITDLGAINLQQMTQFERDIQNRVADSRWFVTKEIHEQADMISARQADAFVDVKNQLRNIELAQLASAADIKYAGLANTSRILEQMGADKYDNMKDKIDALREKCEHEKFEYGFNLLNYQQDSLKQMVNSVDQNQKFASKTTQFGTGNTSGTAQTANQGWGEYLNLDDFNNDAEININGIGGTTGNSRTTDPSVSETTSDNDNDTDIDTKIANQITANTGEIIINSGTVVNITNNYDDDDDDEHVNGDGNGDVNSGDGNGNGKKGNENEKENEKGLTVYKKSTIKKASKGVKSILSVMGI